MTRATFRSRSDRRPLSGCSSRCPVSRSSTSSSPVRRPADVIDRYTRSSADRRWFRRGRTACGCRRQLHHRLRRGRPSLRSSTAWRSATSRCRSSTSTASGCGRFNWCDFDWDPRVFPDAEGMLARLHAQGSAGLRLDQPVHRPAARALFAEAQTAGYLRATPGRSRLAVGPLAGRHGHRRLHQSRRRPRGSRPSCAGCSSRASTASRPTSASASRSTSTTPTAATRRACTTSTPSSTTRPCTRCSSRQERGRGRAVRAVGDRRRPVVARALGRRLDVDVRVDGRDPARRAVARLAGSRSGATTSADSRARRMPRSSSAGSRSACSGSHSRFHGSAARTACRGRSTTRPSRSPGASRT